MNPRDAEKLLGGYATGTLSEAERQALFAAALEDQALFDALADEETLRALLADPAAREQLLAVLTPPAVPFWRRPSAMALAASLVAAIGVGILVKEVKPPEAPRPVEEKAASAPSQEPQAKVRDSKPEAPAKPAPRLAKRAEPTAPPPPPPPAAAPSAVQAERQDQAPAGAAAGASVPMELRKAEPAPQSRDASSIAYFAPGVVAAVASPEWVWGPEDPNRLAVRWDPHGHLYLLSRDASGAHRIEPRSTALQPDGRLLSVFTVSPGSVPLDLYWLPKAADSPTLLPAEGPVDGFRVRVRPATSPKR